MHGEKHLELLALYTRTLEAAQALHSQAEEVYKMTKDTHTLSTPESK